MLVSERASRDDMWLISRLLLRNGRSFTCCKCSTAYKPHVAYGQDRANTRQPGGAKAHVIDW